MKRTEVVMTRLDGRQPIEWWDQEDFHGRVTRVYTGEFGAMKLESEMPIPDDSIVCDYCGLDIMGDEQKIVTFPVPVFHGSALCPACYAKYITGGGG